MTETKREASVDLSTPTRPWPDSDGLENHLRAGHDLIPLHRYDAVINGRPRGKSPRDADWTRRTYDARAVVAEALRDGNNVGVRLGDRDLVVDVDPRNFTLTDPDGPPDDLRRDSFAELCAALGLDPSNWPRVAAGGGGTHYYLRKPEDVRVLDSLPAFPGVEFKSKGRQVLAAGSVHPSGRPYVLDSIDDGIGDPPPAPAALIDAIRRPAPSKSAAAGELTPDQMARWLDQLDPEDFRDHDRWLELMMSCHHATAGEGRQEFIDWSTGDPPYADHEQIIGRRWDSLHTDRPGSITAKTLYKRVYEAGGAEPMAPPEEDFEPWDGEAEPASEMPSELAEVCRRWVWVADANAFFDRIDGRSYNNAQFEGLYCHLVPAKTTIVRQALKGILPMLKLSALSYRPGMGELPGDGTLNLWRPSDVRPERGDVSWFLDHMAHLVPDDRERGILLDFLAHLVQHPGEKVNFAPLIQGGQGTGKSAVGILMERILGENNVARPSNSELKENFTGWLRGKALVVVEELMAGGSRDLANKLKPLITDPRVSIREMYRPGYTMTNTVNFLMFTNHREAIPVEADDRRYFVIFSPAQPKEPAYYDRLFGEILGNGAAHVAHWLRERELSDFDPKGRAPATAAKQEMRLGTMGEAEAQLIELRDSGHPALAADLANVEAVAALLDPSVRNRTPRPGHAVAKFLREEMGAVQLDGRSRLADGTMRVLWALRNHEKWKSETPAARGRAYDAQQLEEWRGEG